MKETEIGKADICEYCVHQGFRYMKKEKITYCRVIPAIDKDGHCWSFRKWPQTRESER